MDICMEMCMDLCTDICVAICIDMCIGMCPDISLAHARLQVAVVLLLPHTGLLAQNAFLT